MRQYQSVSMGVGNENREVTQVQTWACNFTYLLFNQAPELCSKDRFVVVCQVPAKAPGLLPPQK